LNPFFTPLFSSSTCSWD